MSSGYLLTFLRALSKLIANIINSSAHEMPEEDSRGDFQ